MTNVRGFCYDDETGEVSMYHINEETGEPSNMNDIPPIPMIARQEELPDAPELSRKYTKFPKGYVTRTKKFQSLKANILAGSNPVSYRMLLIPTVVMIFPGLFCVALMILEIYLHVLCHKKSKHLKDPNLYYRSPFHVVTSNFCGVCRDCETASKIEQLQDQRRNRYSYLKGIAI